jgi:hypothetical protein
VNDGGFFVALLFAGQNEHLQKRAFEPDFWLGE